MLLSQAFLEKCQTDNPTTCWKYQNLCCRNQTRSKVRDKNAIEVHSWFDSFCGGSKGEYCVSNQRIEDLIVFFNYQKTH